MNESVQLGRYSLLAKLASGGMATVYLGRLNGEAGFGRIVAIKRLHRHLAIDPRFVEMFHDEARLAARIQHPNVVPTVDVVMLGRELCVVMEYVKGESLVALLRTTVESERTLPVPVATAIGIGMLNGLHAAHDAMDEQGRPLSIVHRDVSPQNILVGVDGVTRVLDFGIAKAAARVQGPHEGQLKGKIAYMAPEQVHGDVSQRSDIYSAGVVLWECLTCTRLFVADTEMELLRTVVDANIRPPSEYNSDVSPVLDRIVMKALSKDPSARYATAREMAEELDHALRPASTMVVASWMQELASGPLAARSRLVADLERNSTPLEFVPPPSVDTPTRAMEEPPKSATPRPRWPLFATLALVPLAALVFVVRGPSPPAPAPATAPAEAVPPPVVARPDPPAPVTAAPVPEPSLSARVPVPPAEVVQPKRAAIAPRPRPAPPPTAPPPADSLNVFAGPRK